MARKKAISDEVREQVIALVEKYNEDHVPPIEPQKHDLMANFLIRFGGKRPPKPEDTLRYGAYRARFRGSFLYLDRGDFQGQPSKMCRLKWTGDMENWEFAIYKYSSESYDPDEWFFPGAGEADGTVMGAIRATLKAYPG